MENSNSKNREISKLNPTDWNFCNIKNQRHGKKLKSSETQSSPNRDPKKNVSIELFKEVFQIVGTGKLESQ